MYFIDSAFVALRSFFEAGGNVLWVILLVTILMWTFIIERLWFFTRVLPKRLEETSRRWHDRDDTTSWFAGRIRDQMISEVSVETRQFLLLIKTLMAILPLLGLLGTVTGMINVFDVMAFAGTGNARLMAGGVSKATIPTMAGLTASLSGLYFAAWLERKSSASVGQLEDMLIHH